MIIVKKEVEFVPFSQLCLDHDSITQEIGLSNLWVSKIYFIFASRINLLLLTE